MTRDVLVDAGAPRRWRSKSAPDAARRWRPSAHCLMVPAPNSPVQKAGIGGWAGGFPSPCPRTSRPGRRSAASAGSPPVVGQCQLSSLSSSRPSITRRHSSPRPAISITWVNASPTSTSGPESPPQPATTRDTWRGCRPVPRRHPATRQGGLAPGRPSCGDSSRAERAHPRPCPKRDSPLRSWEFLWSPPVDLGVEPGCAQPRVGQIPSCDSLRRAEFLALQLPPWIAPRRVAGSSPASSTRALARHTDPLVRHAGAVALELEHHKSSGSEE